MQLMATSQYPPIQQDKPACSGPSAVGSVHIDLVRRFITWKRLSGLDALGALSCLQGSAQSLQSRALGV
jgi:hypothetical protein